VKLKAYIICHDRTVKEINVNPQRGFFQFNKGIYCITNVTTLAAKDEPTNFNTKPELFYFEKNPIPINESTVNSASFLEDLVIENALRDTGKPRGQYILNIVSNLLNHPGKILGVGLAVTVTGILIRYVLLGG